MEFGATHRNTVSTKSIAFAIVVFRQIYVEATAFTSLIASLANSQHIQDARIFIYDNTDTPGWNLKEQQGSLHQPVNYFHNPLNPGISVAYNYMAAKAGDAGCNWIVFLDQDTNLPLNAVEKYFAAIDHQPEVLIKAPVLMVGHQLFSPSGFFLKRTVALDRVETGVQPIKKYTMVNSGLLVNLDLFFKVQGYDEKLKLDFADFVFIDKIRAVTDQFEILGITCQHDFSNNETDIKKSLTRYSIFIKDLANCPRKNMLDGMGYFLVGAMHLLKLSIKFRSLRFLQLHLK